MYYDHQAVSKERERGGELGEERGGEEERVKWRVVEYWM